MSDRAETETFVVLLALWGFGAKYIQHRLAAEYDLRRSTSWIYATTKYHGVSVRDYRRGEGPKVAVAERAIRDETHQRKTVRKRSRKRKGVA